MSGKWRVPIRGVGEPVTLTEGHVDTVMFVCAENLAGEKVPIGTAFLVAMPGASGAHWSYFVTAYHVVRNQQPTWIRMRRLDGADPDDFSVSQWVPHSHADVAVTPLSLEDSSTYLAQTVGQEVFADKWPHSTPIHSGQKVYFMGLLHYVETMNKRAIPMMRGGIIGALYQENLPVNLPGSGTKYEKTAHLVDCYSRGGFSRSPVWVDVEYVEQVPGKLQMTSQTALLGLISAHFGDERGNEGIAIVIPIEAVRELLENDKFLVEWRERQDAEYVKHEERQEAEYAATPDSLNPAVEMDDEGLAVKKRRTDKFTLHPRGFEDAVREVWEADPAEKKD